MALLAAWPETAHAQGPPINTQNAFVTALSGGAFRTFFLTFDRSGLRLDGEKVTDPLSREVHVRGQMFVLPYELVSNRLVVMGVVPYLDKSLEMGPADNRQELSVNGFGDLALAAKLGIYQLDRPNRTTRVALFGRLKLPTGDDDAPGPEGQLLPKSLQLGTGSVDYSAGVILTHSVGPVGLSGDLIYDINTVDDGFAFGDVLHYDIALGYRILPRVYRMYPAKQINLYLEANGTWSQRSTLEGTSLIDSGGNVLRLSPGVQFIPLANLLVEVTYQVPVWQGLNGAQLEFDPTFKVGLRWLIF
ncbi:MAG: transporter [Acidobacteria bacterium]|nr:transporter [Acidobacteriota bacterium]